jgi:hypothetical protein
MSGWHALDNVLDSYQHTALGPLVNGVREVWEIIGPGGRLHPDWFLEHKGHLVIEGVLMVVIFVMLLQHRFRPAEQEEEDGLTEKVGSTYTIVKPKHRAIRVIYAT